MTDLYSEWRDFYAEKVRSWMSLEELRAECGKLTTTDAPSTELLLIHAMHALEGCEQRDEALLRQALRLADDAAESVICTEGHSHAPYHWELTHEQIAADPYLGDCIAHLEWRGIARRFDAEDGVTVIFEEQL